MFVLLIRTDKIIKTVLPKTISGDYWIVDVLDNDTEVKIINIEEKDSVWHIKSNNDYEIIDIDKRVVDHTIIKDYDIKYIKSKKDSRIFILYCCPINDESYTYYEYNNIDEITIGTDTKNSIVYNCNFILPKHTRIYKKNSAWYIEDLNSNYGTYLNDLRIKESKLNYGDIIFILGLKIILLKNRIIINNPINSVKITDQRFVKLELPKIVNNNEEDFDDEILLYNENDYFLRAPRFKTSVEREVMNIDAPPAKDNTEETPLIYMIGTMMTTGVISAMTIFTALDGVSAGTRTFASALPSIITGGVMLISMMLFPVLNKRYQKKVKIRKEKERQKKYRQYIDYKKEKIDVIMKNQKQILIENFIPLEECENIILNQNRQLWERKIEHNDFLMIRLGIGDVAADIDIKYPEFHFTLENDELKGILKELVDKSKDLIDVPVTISLVEKYILALVGKHTETVSFMKNIILQLMTFHSYEDLKLVFLLDKKTAQMWEYIKTLPYAWSNDKQVRFFATDYEEMQQISSYLEKELQTRVGMSKDSDYKSMSPYYIVITDNYSVSRNIELVMDILKQKKNIGFNIIVINEDLSTLPNECTTFINVNNNSGGVFESELISTKQKEFMVDSIASVNFDACYLKIANKPIKFVKDLYSLPNMYTFLEMYNVGKVEQLNSISRWKMNDSTLSLQAPVGVDTHGMQLKLDIHEKAHGPHGLIAGMTGSGKSEFIMTYILSLAINYHPNDLSVILIDYKGGGLAGAFENETTGIRLPHLAGKITNIDTSEIQRALVSIQSELRRRQKIFSDTRKKLNEGVIDIYKYQKLYHSGVVTEPVSHLIIISDEFAELKLQQPEFMDQLISTARIGRSLGVHLILATQKPSGIVNDQIRSNSRFRICLKVQEASDSMDVINVPDAASIKQTGRFFLQVGYNEYFSLGQSAWTGASYIPMDKIQKNVDNSIKFINNIGVAIKEANENPKINNNVQGEQLTSIVKYLSDIATKNNISIKQLWLSKIPAIIKLADLRQKYKYKVEENIINPIIGEYDDPFNQRKGLLTANLSDNGNTIIYGATGSGKEMLITTLLYEIMDTHTPEEANFYILDFGTEALRSFSYSPFVGEILSVNDSEKIDNLFEFLRKIMNDRKKMFLDYGGDYDDYIKESGKKLPTIIIVINNYEAFLENYADYEEEIIQMSREAKKYGIVLILSVSASNSARYKLVQNFEIKLVLRQNDESDYSNIIGNTNKLFPDKYEGRGLVKLEGIYEFQTATIEVDVNITSFIKDSCKELSNKYTTIAPKIPTLPKEITFDFVKEAYKNLSTVPLGIERDNLGIATYDFKKEFVTVINTQDIGVTKNFTYSLVTELSYLSSMNFCIIDAEDLLAEFNFNNYYNKNLDKAYNELISNIDAYYKIYEENGRDIESLKKYKHNVYLIVGLGKLKEKLNGILKFDLETLFSRSKILNKFNFIIIDNEMELKRFIYDDWYRNNIVNNNGIYIGNGFSNQYTIKISKIEKSQQEDIGPDFGYYILRGNPVLIKLIKFEKVVKKDE